QFLVEQLSNVPSETRNEDDWTTYETTRNVAKQISDDTTGGWRGVTGSIDYQTGAFTILALEQYTYPEYVIKQTFNGYVRKLDVTNTAKTQTFNGSTITAIAQASNLTHAPYNENITSPELTIDLLPLMDNTV
ncbi:hypothetical protein, partial [Endozoicomonas atrinae]|uniref:hypothetical protein n=1 Tax=Endozoicomonas atrinae TaxID=1333660 RepID=UPI0015862855